MMNQEHQKSFFSKYLPVEGEIKIGDRACRTLGKKTTISDCLDDEHGKWLRLKGYQKGKLFLCSRDVQVGDETVCIYRDGDTTKIGYHLIYDGEMPRDEWIKHISFVDTRYDFKVIGEISPSAVWVKEGDVFDENSIIIKCLYCNEENSHHPKCIDKRFLEIKIKCPTCKTFH